MFELISLIASALAGFTLGVAFFGGLLWTIRRGMISNHPAMWFTGSLLTRMALALSGFHFLSVGDWRRLIATLVGFIAAREVIMRRSGRPQEVARAS